MFSCILFGDVSPFISFEALWPAVESDDCDIKEGTEQLLDSSCNELIIDPSFSVEGYAFARSICDPPSDDDRNVMSTGGFDVM